MEYLQYRSIVHTKSLHLTVLNLIINGIPSILQLLKNDYNNLEVLNLIINGIPSILI